jgi:hypothetical protein
MGLLRGSGTNVLSHSNTMTVNLLLIMSLYADKNRLLFCVQVATVAAILNAF